MKNANLLVALLLGALIGFVVGRATVTTGGLGKAEASTARAGVNNDGGKTPADLPSSYLKEKDLTAVTFTGLTDQQKYAVLKATNETTCDCGCSFGSIASCRAKDPNCPKSPQSFARAIDMAKQGKSSDEIKTALGGGGAAAPARPAAAAQDDSVYKVDLADAFVKGPADAKVTIVEFSDFQCPFCGRVGPTLKQVEETYGKDVRIAWKNNPLSFHPNAMPAAEAAMAAGEQGKFWQMHDKLFADQQALSPENYEKYAKELGLNMSRFKAAIESHKFKAQIDADMQLASSLGASGTPSFFINGKKLRGAQPFPAFQAAIDDAKKRAEEKISSGVKPTEVYAAIVKDGRTSPAPAAAAPSQPARAAGPKKVELGDSPAKGPKYAKVNIVVFSDFQCPFCSRVEPTLAQIEKTYAKDVRFVWKNQPLSFHPNAMPAAEAAMAAGEQGKFWEMHDKLFANQQALSRDTYEKYAQELGLNMSRFKQALDTNKFKAAIQKDADYGMQVGANGTPTFFINGRELSGAQPFESFKSVIDEEIKKADELIAKGTKLPDLYEKIIASAPAPSAAPAGGGAAAGAGAEVVQNVTAGAAPVKGPANAKVTIVEYSDFQCPFCSRVEPTLTRIMDEYKGKVRIAWKNQPLPFHQYADVAAQAAMAAHEQGKFWEMHEKLFANQQALDRASIEKYAETLGLNMSKFRAAIDSGKFRQYIDADKAEGTRVGANGTPTFFINGRQLVGAQPYESFKAVIDQELQKVAQK